MPQKIEIYSLYVTLLKFSNGCRWPRNAGNQCWAQEEVLDKFQAKEGRKKSRSQETQMAKMSDRARLPIRQNIRNTTWKACSTSGTW